MIGHVEHAHHHMTFYGSLQISCIGLLHVTSADDNHGATVPWSCLPCPPCIGTAATRDERKNIFQVYSDVL